jgi:hypothetical protein
MREMTNRERRLTTLFGLAIFILINLMLLVFLRNQRTLLQQRQARVHSQEQQAEGLLADEKFWDSRAKWLEENKPIYALSGEATADLAEMLRSTASEHGLDAKPPILDEPKSLGTHEEATAIINVTGELRAVIGWLAQIQQPGKFISVVSMKLEPTKDAGKVVCDLRVAKWFFLGEPRKPAAEGGEGAPATSSSVAPAGLAPGLILPVAGH